MTQGVPTIGSVLTEVSHFENSAPSFNAGVYIGPKGSEQPIMNAAGQSLIEPGFNILDNGNFDIWSRQGGSVPTTIYNQITSGTADRWYCLPSGASITSVTQDTAAAHLPTNTLSYQGAKITGATGVTTVDFGQRLEALTVADSCMGNVTVSCSVYNGTGAPLTPSFVIQTPATKDSWGTPTDIKVQAWPAAIAAGAIGYYAFTFNPSAYSNIANGMAVVLRFPSGALAANTQYATVSQFRLDLGQAAQAYLPESLAVTGVRCRRFCQLFGNQIPNEVLTVSGFTTSQTAAFVGLRFPQSMRGVPILGSIVNSAGAQVVQTGIQNFGTGPVGGMREIVSGYYITNLVLGANSNPLMAGLYVTGSGFYYSAFGAVAGLQFTNTYPTASQWVMMSADL